MSIVTLTKGHVVALAELLLENPEVGDIDLLEDQHHGLQVTLWAEANEDAPPVPRVLAHASVSVAGTIRDLRLPVAEMVAPTRSPAVAA